MSIPIHSDFQYGRQCHTTIKPSVQSTETFRPPRENQNAATNTIEPFGLTDISTSYRKSSYLKE